MIPTLPEAAAKAAAKKGSASDAISTLNFSDDVQQHYRALLRRLNWPSCEMNATPQTLGVTSGNEGEGVTTVALQLAATAAAMTQGRVLLVDAHVEKPAASRLFGLQTQPGFAQAVLTGDIDSVECHATAVARLSVLAAGSLTQNMDQVYDSPSLAGLVEELKSQFELVVFDLPAAGASCAPLRLAELLDGVLLVVESQRARRQDARRVRDLLAHARVRLVGAVLNRRR